MFKIQLTGKHGELNRIPIYIHRKIIIIKYWIKILNLDQSCLLSKPYRMLKSDVDNSIIYDGINWAFNSKQILDESELTIIWQNQFITQTDLQPIKRRILDIYPQQWYAKVNNSPRLNTYCLFKN